MATVLKREGSEVRTYYRCVACEEEARHPESEAGEAEEDTAGRQIM